MGRSFALAVLLIATIPGASALAQSVEDVTGLGCRDQWCEASVSELRRDIPKALDGDYEAQRNVSFCLATGCDGAIQTNKPLGCAWRLVILGSGNSKATSGDARFLEVFCARQLTATERGVAEAQAANLHREIYKREIKQIAW